MLDLACGNGYIERKLARAGARVTGVDASAPSLLHSTLSVEAGGRYVCTPWAHLLLVKEKFRECATGEVRRMHYTGLVNGPRSQPKALSMAAEVYSSIDAIQWA